MRRSVPTIRPRPGPPRHHAAASRRRAVPPPIRSVRRRARSHRAAARYRPRFPGNAGASWVPRRKRSSTRPASTESRARYPSHFVSAAHRGRRSGPGGGVSMGWGSVQVTRHVFHVRRPTGPTAPVRAVSALARGGRTVSRQAPIGRMPVKQEHLSASVSGPTGGWRARAVQESRYLCIGSNHPCEKALIRICATGLFPERVTSSPYDFDPEDEGAGFLRPADDAFWDGLGVAVASGRAGVLEEMFVEGATRWHSLTLDILGSVRAGLAPRARPAARRDADPPRRHRAVEVVALPSL